MSQRFSGLQIRNYVFRTPDGDRNVIAIYAGSKRIGFIEYDHARQFVDQVHDLCDEHERKARTIN